MDASHRQSSELTQDQDHAPAPPDLPWQAKSVHNPDQNPHQVISERINVTPSDLVLSVTFLGITLLGILFVLVILIIWLKNYLSPVKNDQFGRKSRLPNDILKIMEQYDTNGAGKSFKIEIDDSKKDDFEFKLPKGRKEPGKVQYVDDNHRNLSVTSTRNYGGSSPKLPEEDQPQKETNTGNQSGSKFVFPTEAAKNQASTSKGNVIESKCGKFKIAIPEQQWIFHQKAPLEYKGFSINMPKPYPLAEAVKVELGAELTAVRPKTFSMTRSPSLEKDDKSPFINSAKSAKGCEFKFPAKKSDSKQNVGIEELKLSRNNSDDNVFVDIDKNKSSKRFSSSQDNFNTNDKIAEDIQASHQKYSLNGRRYGSVNSSLCICTITDTSNAEKSEMHNSPRAYECSSAKEKSTYTRFNFSPKQLSSSACDTNTPKSYGSEQRFFPIDKPPASPKQLCSPKVFGENTSRNTSPKPGTFCGSPKSPRCHSGIRTPRSNKENFFVFDRVHITADEVDSAIVNNRKTKDNVCSNANRLEQPKLLKQNSFDVSRSNDRNAGHYKQNSLDNMILFENNNCKSDTLSCLSDNNKQSDTSLILDKSNTITLHEHAHITPNYETDNNNSTISKFISDESTDPVDDSAVADGKPLECHNIKLPAPISVEIRRQRLKSISLDSDNAKIIEQNLALPIAKHLKQEDLAVPATSCFEMTRSKLSCGNITPSIVINKETRFSFDHTYDEPELKSVHYPISDDSMQFSPNVLSPKRRLLDSSNTKSFIAMQPRFSPKEFEMTITEDTYRGTPTEKRNKLTKNLKNLTIDLSKKDSDLEKELLEFERLYSEAEKRLTPKTPTLKVKATSLDSSDTVNLSLPQKKALDVPQNSISVPNTPKRQFKRIIGQKILKKSTHYNTKLNEIAGGSKMQPIDTRKIYPKSQTLIDSGIYLRDNHANLMLYQGPKFPSGRIVCPGKRWMGSFDENMAENTPEINVSDEMIDENEGATLQSDQSLLGSNLNAFKSNLSVSSTNLKTLPEGVPSNDFEPSTGGKVGKKSILQRRGSNQSLSINLDATQSNLKYSTLSLQGSNCSLTSFGMSSHNLASIRNSASNFSLNTDNRQKKNILERRNSNTSLTLNLEGSNSHLAHPQRVSASASFNVQQNVPEQSSENNGKKCLLQRRGSNNSLTLNIKGSSNLHKFSSNSSLNISQDAKTGHRKSLLERRSSNTSLALNVSSGTQLNVNRGLSISNYNLNGSTCNLSRYNSNQSISNTGMEPKKGLLERRSSNASLTLNIGSNTNIQSQEVPREIEIEGSLMDPAVQMELEKTAEGGRATFASHRRSLSTENLLPPSYKARMQQCQNADNSYFGSHDNLWSHSFVAEMDESSSGQNLTYVGGDPENEMIYAFNERQNTQGFIRNITTKPLSPQSTSEDFKIYLANIQHLQNASNTLTRQHLKDLNVIFRNLYPPPSTDHERHKSSSSTDAIDKLDCVLHELTLKSRYDSENKDVKLPDSDVRPTCSDYQKSLLRNLHQEFWDLPTNFQEKPMVFGSHTKNRYKTILPNEHSRFILKPEFETGTEGYINANFIKGHEYSKNSYIATQGPLLNTIYDFWLMIYQNSCQFRQTCTKTNEDRHFGVPHTKDPVESSLNDNLVQKIVMLTGFVENNRHKCERYFPVEEDEVMEFMAPPESCVLNRITENPFADSPVTDKPDIITKTSFRIRNVRAVKKLGFQIRKLIVEYVNESDSQNKLIDYLTVYHYWFNTWADHKCPKDVSALLDLSLDILEGHADLGIVEGVCVSETPQNSTVEFEKGSVITVLPRKPLDIVTSEQPPTVIHCSAGIGRTGCLIAILNGIKQLETDDRVDILGIVCNMRLNRGGMVQNSEQYELIHKVLCLYEEVYMTCSSYT